MKDFTLVENNLLFIYCGSTRQETIRNLESMREELDDDEDELRELTNAVLEKLYTMSNAEFAAADLTFAFEDDDDE